MRSPPQACCGQRAPAQPPALSGFRRIKVDLDVDTLTSVKPLIAEAFELAVAPESLAVCSENSAIITSAFSELRAGDIRSDQTVPLSQLGLKRGSFIYAAWPESSDEAPAVAAPAPETAGVGASAAAAAAPGLRDAQPVKGATCVNCTCSPGPVPSPALTMMRPSQDV